ncbi:MAG TPA: hypothetical protein VMN56_07390, partial [Casimicrobiaceae bacterium]|nr:hypothetical protein [Casimicrobiaceae bacterium]
GARFAEEAVERFIGQGRHAGPFAVEMEDVRRLSHPIASIGIINWTLAANGAHNRNIAGSARDPHRAVRFISS